MTTLLLLIALQGADTWVGKLSDDDPAVRSEAARQLTALGADALPALRTARDGARDPDHRIVLERLIADIERELFFKNLGIDLVLPEAAPTLEAVANSGYPFTIRLSNANDRDVLMLAYFTIRVLDKDGRELERDDDFARMGALFYDCYLDNVRFRTLAAGATVDVPADLGAEPDPVGFHLGWKIPAAGEYTVEVTYAYDRATWMAKCRAGCAHHEEEGRKWNQAIEWSRTVTTKITVAP